MKAYNISTDDISTADRLEGDRLLHMMPLTEAMFYILLAVRRPNHGYGIIQQIRELTDGRVVLGPGTLYGAVNTLLEKGWISLYSEDVASRKKKEYIITQKGKDAFNQEVKRLNEMVLNAGKAEEIV